MKKTFNVIPIEDYFVVVDEEADVNSGDWFWRESDEHNLVHGMQKAKPNEIILGHSKIIATIGKRIEQLPLIELPQEIDLIALAEEAYPYATGDNDYITRHNTKQDIRRIAWIQGYKAAQSKGIYSEEDMWRAAIFGYDTANNNASKDGTQMTGEEFKAFIKTLQKKPISVELEMEDNGYEVDMEGRAGEDIGWMSKIEIKITNKETNTITPLNVTYE